MSEFVARRPLDRKKLFVWKGTFENWSRAWVRKHAWRVRHVFGSEEDALQECAYVFSYCLNKYSATVDNAAWMMRLYKLVLVSHWNDASEKDRKIRISRDPENLAHLIELAPQCEVNYGPTLVTWNSASAELRHAITIIADAPSELLEIIFSSRSPEITNRQLRRLCKIDGSPDLVGELRALFA